MKWVITGGAMISVLLLLTGGCRGPSTASLPQVTPTLVPVKDLNAILTNPDSQGDSLVYAAAQLQRWGPAAAPAVSGLRRALRYAYSYDARWSAALALAAIGPQAREAIPDLILALDDVYAINATAALALGSIGPEARRAVPDLAARLWSQDPGLRASAAVALDAITDKGLVEPHLQFSPEEARHGLMRPPDDPEGSISGRAREWWEQEGKFQDWTQP